MRQGGDLGAIRIQSPVTESGAHGFCGPGRCVLNLTTCDGVEGRVVLDLRHSAAPLHHSEMLHSKAGKQGG